jgi:O-antigen ligase
MLNILDMRDRHVIFWLFMLTSCALLAIGRLYEVRLKFLNINLTILISSVYIVSVISILLSIKKIILSKTKILFYLFYLAILVINPLLWLVFDVTDFGLTNFINFGIIVVPISFIVVEKYARNDVLNTFYILLAVSCFLALLSSVGLSLSDRSDGRLAILGGGPIVFARWMGFGIISLYFLPIASKLSLKYIVILLFLILALASGSRGPMLALIVTGSVYVFLNFNKVILKIILFVFFMVSVFFFSGIEKKTADFGKLDRVFMNISKNGASSKSTTARQNLGVSSFIILQNYPLGIGAGNWRTVSNDLRPNHLTPDNLEYPHNIFLEVACEYGIQTLILLLLLFIYVFHLSYNKMKKYSGDKTSLYPVLFYLLVYFTLNSLVSGMLNDSRLLFLIISFILIDKPLIAKTSC